jgi:adenine phosphoribosyltransferase
VSGAAALAPDLRRWLRVVNDFPRPGIRFQDITPLLQDPDALRAALDALAGAAAPLRPTAVAGVESRGFLFGAPLADRLGVGFLPVRKPGRLPWRTFREGYVLEYGEGTLELHQDAADAGQRVLLVDDLLATGGTAAAAANLLRRTGAEVAACAFVVELAALGGRGRLHGMEVFSLVAIPD